MIPKSFRLPWSGKTVLPYIKYRLRVIAAQNEKGLSLLEMLISLTFTAVLLGVLSQFLYSGVRFWGKNDQAYRRLSQFKMVFQVTYNDLASAFAGSYLPEFSLTGDEYQLSFWKETTAGLVLVNYRYDSFKKIVYRSAGFWGSKPEENEVFTDIVSWRFEYYKPDQKNWLLEWKPERKDQIPSLVRITVKTKTTDLGSMVIPLKTWRPEEKSDEETQ